MNHVQLYYYLRLGLELVIKIAGPGLLLATIVGFFIALFQAVTQIQDQSLPQTAKVGVLTLTLLMFGGLLAAPLIAFARNIFVMFPEVVQ